MTGLQIIEKLNIDCKLLQSKKSQTDYKIKYVKEYVSTWVNISANRNNITDINFIDCMCNAGVYADGDFCTAIEVLRIFRDMSFRFPTKNFNIFLNDINADRIEIIKAISNSIIGNKINNLNIYFENRDVNIYLQNYSLFNNSILRNASTILFVDPYDFGTVHINAIKNFIKRYYCEVIFNVFTSDFVRNGIDHRIKNCIGNVQLNNKDELIEFISKTLKVGAMKYSFSYRFLTVTNSELYQIFFITPNLRGLEVLKEALWKVFNGQFCHRNKQNSDGMQISLFSVDDDKLMMENLHSNDAKNMLMQKYSNSIVSYNKINVFLMERSMLKESQILRLVIKPLIDDKKIIKQGNVNRANNYKDDSYKILG